MNDDATPPPPRLPETPSRLVGALFFALIFGVPIGQAILEAAHGEEIQCLDLVGPVSNARLRAFEEELRDASFLRNDLLPYYQWGLTATTGHGNELATEGTDGWFYYAEDLESVTGHGYLEEGIGGREALEAIVDFRDQLAAQDVQLLLIPSLSKEMADPQFLSRFTEDLSATRNPDHQEFLGELDAQGLHFVRMDELLEEIRIELDGGPVYLPRDTHWRPETMGRFAEKIATRISAMLGQSRAEETPFVRRPVDIESEGDLVRMLRLPARPSLIEPMRLRIDQIIDTGTGQPVQPSRSSDVLLMGDSMTRVFSDPDLGLGEGGGLGEHLALHLGRPVDVIAIAGGSATATREALARRPEGLAGKRLVVWQFGVRMLAGGPDRWRKVPLPPPSSIPAVDQPEDRRPPEGRPPEGRPPEESGDTPLRIRGRITELTPIPEGFDYEFFLAITEYEVLEVLSGEWVPEEDDGPLWVGHVVMRNRERTEPSRFAVGEIHDMTLEDINNHHDLEQVSWMDRTDAGFDIYYPVDWSRHGE